MPNKVSIGEFYDQDGLTAFIDETRGVAGNRYIMQLTAER
jgi:hypothetical protein